MGIKGFFKAAGNAVVDGLVVMGEVINETAQAEAEAEARVIVLQAAVADARVENALIGYIQGVMEGDTLSWKKEEQLHGIATWCEEKKFSKAAEIAFLAVSPNFGNSYLFYGPDRSHNMELARIVANAYVS